MKPVIDVGAPALIMIAQTGIVYSNQAGGIACLHPKAEGAVVQPEWISKFEVLEKVSCDYGCFGASFDNKAQNALEAVWPEPSAYDFWWIRLDQDRLELGTEAWIPVIAYRCGKSGYKDDEAFLNWVDGRHGFLATENCD